MSEQRRGVLMGVSAYVLWGIFPLYWPLLRPAKAIEILAHRITWSLLFVGFLLVRSGGLAKLRSLDKGRIRTLAAASCFIALNWGVYIWAVNHGHVLETSLGYFINPLVTMLLGVVVLREHLRRPQWIAIGLAGLAVAILTIDYGQPPWIAIVLALTFGGYGLLKKRAGVGAVEGLAVETALLFAPAVGYLASLEANGTGVFGHGSWTTTALLVSSGIVTAVPLLLFAGSANRMPLSMLGPLQYISPTLQFLCGVLAFHEAMPPSRWIGFLLVWSALGIFAADGVVRTRALERTIAR
ncbi:Protein rarD [Labilithrix luteola]|uniref:Protein rarD n=1 Tax=Labilithrix luteola TaxID=1391654 RepID=A0A0K1PKG9_9BACT|nr:EamA family transporter RarD [Labilithrix luteola]AKU93604.1 Protein rarD [Labilithrix luteola]